jgi:hypothetical protein
VEAELADRLKLLQFLERLFSYWSTRVAVEDLLRVAIQNLLEIVVENC